MKGITYAALVTAILATGPAIAAASEWAAFGEPGKAASITRSINIAAGEMYFKPEQVTAKVGDTIKFVVTNEGRKDHEFVIGDETFVTQHIQEMAAMPNMKMDDPNELDLKPGETKSVIWHFTKAGNFMFVCAIPTHADLGMEGDLIIK